MTSEFDYSAVPLFASTVTGEGTATAAVTFAGGPAKTSGSVSAAVTVNDGADKDIVIAGPVEISPCLEADELAADYAAALNGAQDEGATVTLVASASGSVVTVTESGGATITAVTAGIL